MLKQVIVILLLTVLSIMFKSQLSHALDAIVGFHNYLASTLHVIFSDDEVGRLIQDMIALLVIPLLCGLLVTLGFWFVKRAAMPHMMAVIWMVWLVLIVTMIAQDGMVTNQMANQSSGSLHATVHRQPPIGQQQIVGQQQMAGRHQARGQQIPGQPRMPQQRRAI